MPFLDGESVDYPTNPNIIIVGPEQPHKTIQAGIDASSPGDLIQIEKGTYNEDPVLPDDRTLKGPDATLNLTNGMTVGDITVCEFGAMLVPDGKVGVTHTGTGFASFTIDYTLLTGTAIAALSTGDEFFGCFNRVDLSGAGRLIGSSSTGIGQASYDICFRNVNFIGAGGALYELNNEDNRAVFTGTVVFETLGTGTLMVSTGAANNTVRFDISVVDVSVLSDIAATTEATLITSSKSQPISEIGAGKIHWIDAANGLDVSKDQDAFTLFTLQNPNSGSNAMAGGFMSCNNVDIYIAALSDNFSTIPAYAGQGGLLLSDGDAVFMGGPEVKLYTGFFLGSEILRFGIDSAGKLYSPLQTHSEITSNRDNWDLSTFSTNLRISSNGDYDITGILAGTSKGEDLLFTNVGTNIFTFKNEDSNSDAENRILIFGGGDYDLHPNDSIVLKYDSITERYRQINDHNTPVGNMSIYDNAVASVISTADVWHFGLGFSAGKLNGWSFTNGGAAAITAFTDAGGGKTTVSSAGHVGYNGAAVSIVGTTNYNKQYIMSNVVTGVSFEIVEAFAGDDATGTAIVGDHLTADSFVQGNYLSNGSASFRAAAINTKVEFGIFEGATLLTDTVRQAQTFQVGDVANLPAPGIPIKVSPGGIYTPAIRVLSGTANVTIIHGGVGVEKVH